MEGAVLALGIAGGILGIIEPAFRPIAAESIVLGAVVSAILVWRRRSESHRPTRGTPTRRAIPTSRSSHSSGRLYSALH